MALLRKQNAFVFFDLSICKPNFDQVQLQLFRNVSASLGRLFPEHLKNLHSDDPVSIGPALPFQPASSRAVLP